MKNKKELVDISVGVMYLGIAMLSFFLFYKYITGEQDSDFTVHITTVLQGRSGYSLMHKLIEICGKLPYFNYSLSLLMSLIIIATIIGVRKYIDKNIDFRGDGKFSNLAITLVSVLTIFTSNIYIPFIFPHLYNHYTKVSQPWHNSTFILMRFFSVFVVYYFFKIYDEIKGNEKISKYDAILFWLSLNLCNYSKPNFFLAFAPISIIVFMYLLVTNRRRFKELVKWGILYILTVPIIIYMVSIVYDEESQSSIAFSTENFADYVINGKFLIYEFSNLLFPVFVTLLFLYIKFKNKNKIDLDRIIIAFGMYIISHLQQLLMIDDGPRKADGNYAWGVYGMGMILFMVCITELFRAYNTGIIKKNAYLTGMLLFLCHVLCGCVYFILLLTGKYYLI